LLVIDGGGFGEDPRAECDQRDGWVIGRAPAGRFRILPGSIPGELPRSERPGGRTATRGRASAGEPTDLAIRVLAYPAVMARLLVVEDDETIGSVVSATLSEQGHEAVWARTGRDALCAAKGNGFALVLLDLGLPDIDGIQVCRRIRVDQPLTVLVILTARTEEMDVVVGLDAGADDYLTKPVRLGELLARVRAHLRRAEPADPPGQPFQLGDLVVDAAARRVTVAGQDLILRTKEFDLLARLAASPGQAISRRTLMSEVWDEHWYGPTKTLDVHVAALRRKLTGLPKSASLPEIVTLRGHGYRLDPPG
jgi:DNA-binding response OmpR family regulator